MLSKLPLPLFLLEVVLPLAALQLIGVPVYIVLTRRLWPRMPRREAIVRAPLAAPIAFALFFGWFEILGRSEAGGAAALLLCLFVLTWLPGLAAGAATWRRIARRR